MVSRVSEPKLKALPLLACRPPTSTCNRPLPPLRYGFTVAALTLSPMTAALVLLEMLLASARAARLGDAAPPGLASLLPLIPPLGPPLSVVLNSATRRLSTPPPSAANFNLGDPIPGGPPLGAPLAVEDAAKPPAGEGDAKTGPSESS